MKSILFLAAIVALAAVALVFIRSRLSTGETGRWPFHSRKPMSVPEQVLYFRLLQALPDHMVLAQVSLSRFLAVDKGHNFQAWHNRINRMSADFVICKKDATVVAVIELDDASHNSKARKAADAKKDRALTAARIPVLRWQAKMLPDVTSIQRDLGQAATTETEPVQRAA